MENLDWLEWDPKPCSIDFDILEHGNLPEKVQHMQLRRSKSLKLTAVGKGLGHFSLDEHIQLRPGESLHPNETVGETRSDELVRLRGVSIDRTTNESSGLFEEDSHPLIIDAQVGEVEISECDLPIDTHIEWIVNFSTDYILSRGTSRERTVLLKRDRGNGDILECKLSKSSDSSYDCFHFECTIGEEKWSAVAGKVSESITSSSYKPGFIEYSNLNGLLPSETIRSKILSSLSFIFGRQLSIVGSTSLSKERIRVCCTAMTIRLVDEKICSKSSRIPFPLGLAQNEYFLDEAKISTAISRLSTEMQNFEIEHSLFLIHLSDASPLDVKAAHLGAAIESLRDTYYKKKLGSKLLSKEVWEEAIKKPLLATFEDAISKLDNPSMGGSIEILRNKLTNLNDKSSNMKYREFFDLISLPIGKVEREALDERNKPAHGHRYEASQYQGLLMITNALRSLFNRTLLKITGASDCYIDYSTYGYPVRDINQPLGGPEGDGNPFKIHLKN